MRSQSVKIIELRFGYFPHAFSFDSQIIQVKAIERTMTSHRQLAFVVKDTEGKRYQLTNDIKKQTWTGRQL